MLNALPKSRQRNGKQDLHQIWMAEGRAEAEQAMDTFEAKYQAKYGKAVAYLTKDRDALLAFYDFPAEHWQHIRTTNPIESVFATVRHRTVRSKGCLSHKTALAISCPGSSRASNSPTAFKPTKPKPAPPPDHVVTHLRPYLGTTHRRPFDFDVWPGTRSDATPVLLEVLPPVQLAYQEGHAQSDDELVHDRTVVPRLS